MAATTPKLSVTPGQIYRHTKWYQDSDGTWKSKYLLVLAKTRSGDIIFRLLTSQQNARPTAPACFHGDPYPGFYLGVLGGPLIKQSWLELCRRQDFDDLDFCTFIGSGVICLITTLAAPLLCNALECAAAADDTTNEQTRRMLDQRALLGCC